VVVKDCGLSAKERGAWRQGEVFMQRVTGLRGTF
jgi:hypothetical protein